MATSLATTISLTLKTTHRTTDAGLSVPADVMTRSFTDSLIDGVVLDAADLVWHGQGTLASAAVDVDLAGGESDEFGNVITMVKIKCVLVINRTTTAGYYLEVGGDANSLTVMKAVTDISIVGPGGFVCWYNPSLAAYAVGAGATDILQISSVVAAQTIDYDAVVIGTSA